MRPHPVLSGIARMKGAFVRLSQFASGSETTLGMRHERSQHFACLTLDASGVHTLAVLDAHDHGMTISLDDNAIVALSQVIGKHLSERAARQAISA